MSIFVHDRAIRIDWWQVVTDLMGAGLSQRDIGARCGIDHGAINRLRNAVHAQPLFGSGVRLLALWMDVCDRDASEVPRVADGVVRTFTA